jgi:hypothetical protein
MDPANNDSSSAVEWLQIRKDAAERIDPATAEVTFEWGQLLDPYGVQPNLPAECRCTGLNYFAMNPKERIWVSFCDLPKQTRDAIEIRLAEGRVNDDVDFV